MRTRLAGLLGLVAVAGLAVGIVGVHPFGGHTAEAAPVAIVNPGFETDQLGDNGFVVGAP